ncbi:MAG: MATE family efflux transporter, partial [Cyanobacteria bacterium P01_E01_bin.35]
MNSQKKPQIKDSILQGNLIKLMFKLSIPSILGVLVTTLNTFIDTLFAGRLIGETALAGISLALPFIMVIWGFTDFLGVGSASVVSRAIGAGDVKTQYQVFSNLIITGVVISLFITVIGYGFSRELITLMGGSGQLALEGIKYLKVYSAGSIFFIIGTACGDVISSEGQIRWTTISMVIYVTANIFLNYLFIAV